MASSAPENRFVVFAPMKHLIVISLRANFRRWNFQLPFT
jgi:hypothetical protein